MIARRIVPVGAAWSGLLGAATVVVFALSVGVGSADAYAGAPPRKTVYAQMATATTVPNPAQPSLPNLDDAATRQRFVCSFAPGSFGISPQLPYDLEGGIDCSSDASGSHDDVPEFSPRSSGFATRRVE